MLFFPKITSFTTPSRVFAFSESKPLQEPPCRPRIASGEIVPPGKIVLVIFRCQKKQRLSSAAKLLILRRRTKPVLSIHVVKSTYRDIQGSVRRRRERSAGSRTCFSSVRRYRVSRAPSCVDRGQRSQPSLSAAPLSGLGYSRVLCYGATGSFLACLLCSVGEGEPKAGGNTEREVYGGFLQW